ncbi:MAG: tRNA-dihydrouridine synthase, partial [Clostridia bacterium]|nr:tRNA-dihydrouridine synthase [Clostridia bacterium]
KKVKQSVQIPVIANGDILSADDAISMLKDTGADGIAIGRGAVGNPFIFGQIRAALSGDSYTPPSLDERAEVALWQLRLAIEDKGERVAVPEARKQIASYLHSFKGAAKIRAKINTALTYAEIDGIFREALKEE